MEKRIGIWEFEKYGLNGYINGESNYARYPISCYRLWETQIIDGQRVWDLPIHLAGKNPFMNSKLNEFNRIFLLAQKYYKKWKPDEDFSDVSMKYTLKLQKLRL